MTTVEQTDAGSLAATGEARELTDDRARAERVAAERRRKVALQNLVIRLVALAIALSLWQIVGMNTDPVLFTTPIKVALAAVDMIWSGELWQALWPSLIVLMIGLTPRDRLRDRGRAAARALPHPRRRDHASTSPSSIRSRRWRWCR